MKKRDIYKCMGCLLVGSLLFTGCTTQQNIVETTETTIVTEKETTEAIEEREAVVNKEGVIKTILNNTSYKQPTATRKYKVDFIASHQDAVINMSENEYGEQELLPPVSSNFNVTIETNDNLQYTYGTYSHTEKNFSIEDSFLETWIEKNDEGKAYVRYDDSDTFEEIRKIYKFFDESKLPLYSYVYDAKNSDLSVHYGENDEIENYEFSFKVKGSDLNEDALQFGTGDINLDLFHIEDVEILCVYYYDVNYDLLSQEYIIENFETSDGSIIDYCKLKITEQTDIEKQLTIPSEIKELN